MAASAVWAGTVMGPAGSIKPEHPRPLSAGGQLRDYEAAGSNGPRAGAAPLSSVACLGGVVELGAAVGRFLDEVT